MENKKLLWELQKEYLDRLEDCYDYAKYNEITLKELLDLGFNNNYLLKEEDYTYRFKLGWVDFDRQYSKKFTEEQLNVKVQLKDYDFDGDGYVIAYIYLVNEEDYKLFK